MYRSKTCGELRLSDAGKICIEVRLVESFVSQMPVVW